MPGESIRLLFTVSKNVVSYFLAHRKANSIKGVTLSLLQIGYLVQPPSRDRSAHACPCTQAPGADRNERSPGSDCILAFPAWHRFRQPQAKETRQTTYSSSLYFL